MIHEMQKMLFTNLMAKNSVMKGKPQQQNCINLQSKQVNPPNCLLVSSKVVAHLKETCASLQGDH